MRTLSRLFLLVTVLGLSACRTAQHLSQEGTPGQSPPLWGWDDTLQLKAKGPIQVKIVLKEQKAYITKGNTEIGWTYVATGIAKYPTPVGSYEVMERTADKHSNLYGRIYDAKGECVNEDAKMGRDAIPEGGKFQGATMAYWMRLTNDGLGMHVGPIPRPGYRASHGCTRLPRDAAKKLFQTVRVGTPVIIVENANDPLPPKRTMEVLPASVKPTVKLVAQPMPADSAKLQFRAPTESGLPDLPPTPKPPGQ